MVMSRIGAWLHTHTRSTGTWINRRRRFRPKYLGGLQFSAPEPIFEANIPAAPGLYAIQVPGSWWRGGAMQTIHLGSSADLHRELMIDGHDDFVAWIAHHRSGRGLYLSVCVMHEPDPEHRNRECARLRRHYLPRHTHSIDEFLQRHVGHRPTALGRRMDGEREP